MQKALIDTNLIIRFLLNDDPKKAIRVEELLSDKNNNYLILDLVVAEIIWVLKSYYQFDKDLIIDKIKALIHLDSISCSKVLLDHALDIWEKNNISYVDSYIIATAISENLKVYSYDLKFDKVNSVTRIEP